MKPAWDAERRRSYAIARAMERTRAELAPAQAEIAARIDTVGWRLARPAIWQALGRRVQRRGCGASARRTPPGSSPRCAWYPASGPSGIATKDQEPRDAKGRDHDRSPQTSAFVLSADPPKNHLEGPAVGTDPHLSTIQKAHANGYRHQKRGEQDDQDGPNPSATPNARAR
jgi:hypothetical protein